MNYLIGFLVALTMAAIGWTGLWAQQSQDVDYRAQRILAESEALDLVTFNQALDTYVQQNLLDPQNLEAPLTAADLGLSPAQGIDALGQTLEGYVSMPWGTPQSWVVLPSTPGSGSVTTSAIYAKYGLTTPIEQETWAGLVAKDVAQLSHGVVVGYVLDTDNMAFQDPEADQTQQVMASTSAPTAGPTAWSQLSHYFPAQAVEDPQTLPALSTGPFVPMSASELNASVGYWLWALQLYNQWGTGCEQGNQTCQVTESFFSLGYSSSCPSNGLTPVSFSTPETASDWPYSMATDPSFGVNFSTVYICIPMPQSTYQTVSDNFSFGTACQSSGQGCAAFSPDGTQIGYTSSCEGSACQTENLNEGEGYNPGNDGTQQGDGGGLSGNTTYLYGTFLINTPGNLTFSVLWSSGWNNDAGGEWSDFANLAGFFIGNVVGADGVTAFSPESGYYAQAWPFTVVQNSNAANASGNENYTILNLE